MWSYLVINIHIVSHAFCEHFVNRTENFVNRLFAGVDDGGSAVHLVHHSQGYVSKISVECFLYVVMALCISSN